MILRLELLHVTSLDDKNALFCIIFKFHFHVIKKTDGDAGGREGVCKEVREEVGYEDNAAAS